MEASSGPEKGFGSKLSSQSICSVSAARWTKSRRYVPVMALPVIEDAAQAIGADYPSSEGTKHAGGIGEFGYFSFYPTKNLGAFGDAGMAIAKDPRAGQHMKVLRNHGMEPKYYHECVGGNFRLDTSAGGDHPEKAAALGGLVQTALGNCAILPERICEFCARTASCPRNRTSEQLGDRGHTYHQFVVRTARRDELREHLRGCGIGTEIYYPVPLHRQQCFAYLEAGGFPESEAAAQQVLALPIFPELTDSEIELVAGAVTAFFKK